MSKKPMPRVTEFDRPFWDACNRGELMLQQCQAPSCGRHVFYPRVCCPHCGAGELAWRRVSGRATVRSFTILHHAQHESFEAELPYCFIAVDLAEGPLMFSRLDGLPPAGTDIRGRPVDVVFVEHTPEQKLPFFRLV